RALFVHGRRPTEAPDRRAITGRDGTLLGSVALSVSATGARHESRWRAVITALGLIAFGVAGTSLLVNRIVGPILELGDASERVADGDLDARFHPSGDVEIDRLASAFERLRERLHHVTIRQVTSQRELTERVRAKTAEIEETRRHLSNVLENVGASILVADLDGTIVSANSHATHIFGIKPEYFVGRNLAEFPDDGRTVDDVLRDISEAQGPIVTEARLRQPDGRQSDLLVTHTVLLDAQGQRAALLQVTKDITPLKNMERRLVSSERMSAMGEMAGEIGHELNNYLMAIGGRAELILAAIDRGADERALQKIRASAAIIAAQVSDMRLLTDGLLESARKETSPKELDLNALLRATIDFVKPQNRFDRIEMRLEETAEPLILHADPQQIRQVVLNLLSNAAEAIHDKTGGEGTILVRTFEGGETVGISVQDDGTGVDARARSRIFEPHFTTKEKGHGFGLAVCHRVVENHGGRIEVASQPGQGATFTIHLPRHPSRVCGSPALS
ncbi:MAG: PAS domain S-box protein, partial [Gemmatimonadetes bacterium]|nr:PAS domain S-box protein [Gemmatimonadota bacterium]